MKSHRPHSARPHKTKTQRVTGVIDVTRRGVGYVEVPGLENDVEIAPQDLATALHGDTVELELRGKVRGRHIGRVLAVSERAKVRFVGVIQKEGRGLSVAPDDRRMYLTIALKKEPSLSPGIKVLVEIIGWEEGRPIGKVIEEIGRAGEHETEVKSAALEQGFSSRFPGKVLEEAKAIDSNRERLMREAIMGRRDFREVPTFTIDPVDAKDFDDALSVEKLNDGGIEVGVHIADVSYWLKRGTAIDREAESRGTSVYLVDRTIPMLPEVLSNDLCSLNEGVDRLTFSAVFKLAPNGKITDRWFGETVIRSAKRFTYEEAQQVLDRNSGPYLTELLTLRDLARIMRKKRESEGAIDFDQEEVKFKLDEKGRPLGVYLKERFETNQLIEDWMLLANREVAEFVYNLAKKLPESARTFIYRIHDVPKQDRLEGLEVFLRAIGHELETKEKVSNKDIKQLFERIKGTPEEGLIKIATMRSMAKAIYATKNIGHFGLSFRYYTHFTSPIRRYPDVMVHRILKSHLDKKPLSPKELSDYERLAIRCSEREVDAAEAERDSIRYKQVEFLTPRVGEVFEGTVSGVAEWGMYVADKVTKAEGLVRLRDMKDDYYVVDAKNYRIVGERTKRRFNLGDSVRVRLKAANLSEKTLDFEVVK